MVREEHGAGVIRIGFGIVLPPGLAVELVERLVVQAQPIKELLQLGYAGVQCLPLHVHGGRLACIAVRRKTLGEEHILVLHVALVARRSAAAPAETLHGLVDGRGAWLDRQPVAILEANATLPLKLYGRRANVVHGRRRAGTLRQRALRMVDTRVALGAGV